jgi:hypothetical protein
VGEAAARQDAGAIVGEWLAVETGIVAFTLL